MAGDDLSLGRQREQALLNACEELRVIASWQIRAPDGTRKESVSGKQQLFGWQMKAQASFGVTRCIQNLRLNAAYSDVFLVVRRMIWLGDERDGHIKPCGLLIHHRNERKIGLAIENRSTDDALQVSCTRNVIYVRVGDNNSSKDEVMFVQEAEDTRKVGTRVDDDRLARSFITENRAVTAQKTNWERFANQMSTKAIGAGLQPAPLPAFTLLLRRHRLTRWRAGQNGSAAGGARHNDR